MLKKLKRNAGILKVSSNLGVDMEDFVSLGFQARKARNENLELQYFKDFCKEQGLKIDITYNAEIIWERKMSEFKKLESKKKEIEIIKEEDKKVC
jgi:hypothetical protein